MADRAKKISELTALTTATGDDLLVIVDDPSGSAVTKKITVNSLMMNTSNVTTSFIRQTAAPALANSSGTIGELRFDSSYIYVCVANNSWKKASLTAW